MATYTKVARSIWTHEAFAAVSPSAKLTYLALISQPKTSLAGSLDLVPARWAAATGLTPEEITATLEELEAADLIAVDYDVEEVAVLHFVADDGMSGSRLGTGVWKAWALMSSPRLRHALVQSFPSSMFDDGIPVPPEAFALRNTPSDTPSDEVCTCSQTVCICDAAHTRRTSAPAINNQQTTNTRQRGLAPSPVAKTTSPPEPDGFAAFWDAYPRKTAKGQARKAYRSALKKGASPSLLLERAEAYARQPDRTDQFTAYPASWLNGERYNDEPEVAPDGVRYATEEVLYQ